MNMKNKKQQSVNVIQDDEKPIERNVLAAAIVDMSSAMKKLVRGGITREAIIILTQHNCRHTSKYPPHKPSQTEVRAVIDSLEELATKFTQTR